MLTAMWRVLTRPSPAAFENVRAGADLGRAIVGTLAIGAATGFVGGLINLLSVGDPIADVLTLTIITPFRLLFALILAQAFLFAASRALGGRGEFATQAYLGALVFVPLNALASLLAAIPSIGAFLAFVILMYSVVVNAIALRTAHGGRTWQISNVMLLGLSFIGGIIGWVAISSIPA